MLLLIFCMYIVQMLTNCHYHDVHMRLASEPHNELQFDFCVIMPCFACRKFDFLNN